VDHRHPLRPLAAGDLDQLGIEGVDVARYLARQGARVTATDAKSAEQLAPRLRTLQGLPIDLVLGGNPTAEEMKADVVFVSQGVPLALPALAAARQQGVPMSSMTRLFLELCPGPVVGISGSNGKTTTTSLVAAMFAAAGRDHVVGGNIGVGLLGLLDRITPETWAVLEISHTQLEMAGRSPHVATLLNVTPNHLDRYSWEDYVALKENLVRYQTPHDVAVLNYSDTVGRELASRASGHVLFFSAREEPPGDAAFLRDGVIVWRQGGVETPVLSAREVPLRGDHNIENVAAAVATASSAPARSLWTNSTATSYFWAFCLACASIASEMSTPTTSTSSWARRTECRPLPQPASTTLRQPNSRSNASKIGRSRSMRCSNRMRRS
jgi:UDP-N-acetylmuramoylalanine--D-glutamate ligase